MRSTVDSSPFGFSAALPFTDKLSNTRGIARGQIYQDHKDERGIQKMQGQVSAAATAPHNGSVQGQGTYDPSAPRGVGAVAGICLYCEYLNLLVFFDWLFVRLF